MRKLLLLIFFLGLENLSFSGEKVGSVTGLPIPRFLMLKSKDVNMRSGPGINYPLKMNYKCYYLPVKVLSEFDSWRLVKDSNGNEGWIHEAMVGTNKYVEIVEKTSILRLPDPKAKAVIITDKGTLAKILRCKDSWCNVSLAKTYKGWVHKKHLWGIED